MNVNCPTVLLDAETGQRIAHFAELDHSNYRAEMRAFIIVPLSSLEV